MDRSGIETGLSTAFLARAACHNFWNSSYGKKTPRDGDSNTFDKYVTLIYNPNLTNITYTNKKLGLSFDLLCAECGYSNRSEMPYAYGCVRN